MRSSSRPTTNFCRLPPDSARASGSGLPLRTSKALITRSLTSSRRFAVNDARLHQLLIGGMAGQHDILGQLEARHGAVTQPLLGHEGGAELAPRGDRRRGRRACRRSTSRRRARSSVSPEIASNSSDWPFPATPAMATISPPATSSEMSLERDGERPVGRQVELVEA